jgi:hypothetical protein
MSIEFLIVCRSGTFMQGSCDDFLGAIVCARLAKRRAVEELPHSHFRVQIRYPSGAHVPSADVRASLRALADKTVFDAVLCRLAASGRVPARSEARTDTRPVAAGFAVGVGSVFSQAGVVAPPDSPDLGNSSISSVL